MAIYGNIENIDAVILGAITSETIHVKGDKGDKGDSGEISDEEIAAAVEAYFDGHPVAEPPDWNQNDPAAKDYIKNRTHWTEQQAVQFFDGVTFTVEDTGKGLFGTELEVSVPAQLTVGTSAIVVFDGETYTAEVKEFEAGLTAVGNWSLISADFEDTGEPFFIAVGYSEEESRGAAIAVTQTAGEHTFSISYLTDNVHQLDPKYIKDMYYEEERKTVLLSADLTKGWKEEGSYKGYWGCLIDSNDSKFTIGKEYKVKLDSSEYVMPLVMQADMVGATFIGFGIIADDVSYQNPNIDHEAPFVLYSWSDDDYPSSGDSVGVNTFWEFLIPYSEPWVNHHIEVIESETTIQTIAKKYLPEETDPTVPEWAKAANKPTYTADEVGAQPKIFTFVVWFETMGTYPSATFAEIKEAYESGADVRCELGAGLGYLFDFEYNKCCFVSFGEEYQEVLVIYSDDTATYTISSYIRNRDVIDNLTSTDTDKPLSAAQGKVLKELVDDIDIPTVPSSLPNPNALTVKGGATEQSYNGSAAKSIIFPYAMPQFYGALGDGTTDDTTAVQSALANNKYVYIPAGTYKLSGTLTVRAGCRLELAPDAVLNFTQTSGNCIALGISSCLCGNHATVVVPYAFTGNAVYVSSAAVTSLTDVPPFTRWTPQWKPARYLTDLNITKPDSRGFHYSVDGTCSGKAVYIEADGSATSTFIWGLNFSGLRIAGAFSYGIHAKAVSNGWNHDMHLEAVIDSCEIGICLEDCNNNYITATIQPRAALTTDNQSVAYAKHGIQLIRSRNTDLSATRVWDWNAANTLWTSGGQYQHIAMVGNCSGTILSDYLYYETSYDIRSLIYTDTPSNLEKMTILQEPFTRWFKPSSDGLTPYFYNGTSNKELLQKDAFDALFQTSLLANFTNKLSTAANTDGTVFNTIGYQNGKRLADADGATIVDYSGNTITGYIPCAANDVIRLKGISLATNTAGAAKVYLFKADHTKLAHVNQSLVVTNGSYYNIDSYTATSDGCSFRIVNTNAAYFRLSVDTSTLSADPAVTVNEEITYSQAGFLADSVKVKASSVVGLEEFVKAVIAENG